MEVNSGLFSAAGLGSSAALSNAMGAALHSHTKPDEPINPVNWVAWATRRRPEHNKGPGEPHRHGYQRAGGLRRGLRGAGGGD
ncbi:MAG: hypothetical protein Ct9H300mP10_06010 [Methanobacteriota archaeon]|nr:MAG: hypothetical protein Ct9H300mP10_06010 [Euryarchaeota archaeon]